MNFVKLVESTLEGLAKLKTPQELATRHKTSLTEILKELQKGIRVEMEHTKKKTVARQIAMDHLFEDPKYYSKLSQIEKLQ